MELKDKENSVIDICESLLTAHYRAIDILLRIIKDSKEKSHKAEILTDKTFKSLLQAEDAYLYWRDEYLTPICGANNDFEQKSITSQNQVLSGGSFKENSIQRGRSVLINRSSHSSSAQQNPRLCIQ